MRRAHYDLALLPTNEHWYRFVPFEIAPYVWFAVNDLRRSIIVDVVVVVIHNKHMTFR